MVCRFGVEWDIPVIDVVLKAAKSKDYAERVKYRYYLDIITLTRPPKF